MRQTLAGREPAVMHVVSTRRREADNGVRAIKPTVQIRRNMSISERKHELVARIAHLIEAADVSQSELARRMQERGWATYSQMTVSRTLSSRRSIGALEYQDLLLSLGVPRVLESADGIELTQLRAFKARVLAAVKES